MFGVEDLVDSLECNVLVAAAIATNRVDVEQFIVVRSCGGWCVQTPAGCSVGVGEQHAR